MGMTYRPARSSATNAGLRREHIRGPIGLAPNKRMQPGLAARWAFSRGWLHLDTVGFIPLRGEWLGVQSGGAA